MATLRRVGVAASCCIVAAVFLALGFKISQAQQRSDIQLGNTVRISAPGDGAIVGPSWIYTDPGDARKLITCGRISNSNDASVGYVYTSFDTGATWRRRLLDNPPHMKWVSEESCVYGSNGHAYFADSAAPTNSGDFARSRFSVFASNDHGFTWKRVGKWSGWMDWTFLASVPGYQGSLPSLVVFANEAIAVDQFGHIRSKIRPAVLELSGGRSFLGPFGTSTTSHGFAGGSVILPDHTALFIAPAVATRDASLQQVDAYIPMIKRHYRVEIFAFSPISHSLKSRASIHDDYGSTLMGPSLVQDTSRGRFRGRLYAAWVESGLHDILWLSVSNDGGYHWSSHPILSGVNFHLDHSCEEPALSDAKLAIDRSGTLGISWSENHSMIVFASSHDGGSTFGRSITVAKSESSTLINAGALPFNEYLADETVNPGTRKSAGRFIDLSHSGLSVRVFRAWGVDDNALTGNANGTFHALWDAPPLGQETGSAHVLFTRSIREGSDIPGISSTLTGITTPRKYNKNCQEFRPALPAAVLNFQIPGWKDISNTFTLHIPYSTYASNSRTIIADITLLNKDNAVVHGPLLVLGADVHSDFGIPVAMNANRSIKGLPVWNATPTIPVGGLRKEASSKRLVLRFKLTHFHIIPMRFVYGDAVAMSIRIFQKNR